MQSLYTITDGSKHTLDLMVLALGQGEVQPMARSLLTSRRFYGLGVIVQNHPRQQARYLFFIDWMFGSDLINLGHMFLGRTHAVNELTVIAQQQQPGGVLVQPSYGLHPLHRAFCRPLPQRGWQQGIDAGIG